jgi:hypothetical protein
VLLEERRQPVVADKALLLLVDPLDQILRISVDGADRLDDIADPGTLLHQARWRAKDLQEAPVADDQALVTVDHAQRLRHVVERCFEKLVVPVQLAIPLLQHPILVLQLLIGRMNGLIRYGKLGSGQPQIVGQHAQLTVCPVQQPVAPEQQTNQRQAAEQHGSDKSREDPMQLGELLLILGDELCAAGIRRRGHPCQLAVEW